MIPYQTYPILFQIGWLKITTYGFFTALAVILATLIARREAKRLKINPDIFYDVLVIVVLSILIGSRLFYVIENWSYYALHPSEILKYWEGGISFFGGFIFSIGAGLIYIWKKKLPIGKVFDAAAIALPFGHFIGRFGCWFRGCCGGLPTNAPWGVLYEGTVRHPTQAYDALGNLAIFIFLSEVKNKKMFENRLFFVYVLLYSALRFTVEFFREGIRYGPFTVAQYVTIVAFGVAAVLLSKRIYTKKH
jgi:phosphatidylglycerol:prolipoprotein diacylglycerol transferase